MRNRSDRAFPVPDFSVKDGDVLKHFSASDGISVRDLFACAALAGLLSCPYTGGEKKTFVKSAYAYADAMIEERKEKEEKQ